MRCVPRLYVPRTAVPTPDVCLPRRLETHEEMFEAQFAQVGAGGDFGHLIKESQYEFKYYCSGRRFCHGALVSLVVRVLTITASCAARELWMRACPRSCTGARTCPLSS